MISLQLFLILTATHVAVSLKNSTCDKRGYLDSCLKQLPPMLTDAQITGLPKSKQEVDTLCNAFKTGMKCVDSYMSACLSPRERHMMEEHVAGARHTFRFLCDDKAFQAEYLTHTTCYRGMSGDWDSCSNRFMGIVREEIVRTKNLSEHERAIGLCCAKFGFLRCIFVTSRYKCQHEAAVFLHRIADTLANVRVHTAHCQGVSEQVCSSTSQQHSLVTLMLVMLVTLVVFIT